MATDRELAQALYAKKKKDSAFDAMGAFNEYYNQKQTASIAIPLDFGKAIPAEKRAEVIKSFNPTTRSLSNPNYYDPTLNVTQPANPDKKGFWQNVGEGLTRTYNFASHVVAFGVVQKNKHGLDAFNPEKVKETWNKTREVSAGQATFGNMAETAGNLVGNVIDPVTTVFNNTVGKITDTKVPKFDTALENHFLSASSNFDILDTEERKKAFEDQTFGKVGSWSADVVARFTLDPTVFVGKAIKVYNVAGYTLKGAQDLKGLLAARTAGEKLTRQQKRVLGTFDDFLNKTDNMNESDLFRVKAIRESSNPAVMTDLISNANKIEDLALRHQTKTDIIHMAMGDHDAYVRLSQTQKLLAAKVGALNMEVDGAKYLGSGIDDLGQPVFDYMNTGATLEKANELIVEHQDELAKVYKSLQGTNTMKANQVPFIDNISGFRKYMANSQNFIDMRAGLAGSVVRFHTGFFYKRPKNWIDFSDNQSVQTVDNLLNRVIGVSEERAKDFSTRIAAQKSILANKTLPKEEIAAAKNELKRLEKDFGIANFTVERRNALFTKYIAAAGPEERSLVYQEIEKELFDTVAKQFGYTTDQIAKAYSMFAGSRTKAHNLIKERSYSGGVDSVSGKKIGAKIIAIPDTEGLTHVLPLPINESQLVKEIATLDIDTMYKILRRSTRSESFGGWDIAQNAYKSAIRGKIAINDLADSLDQFLKFQVLMRLGYPIRNVTEGSMRIMSTVGPMALAHAATAGAKNSIMKLGSKLGLDDVFDFAARHDLETERLILQATRDVSDNPELIDKQIEEITKILAGEIKPTQAYGVGTLEIMGVKFADAKGATPEAAAFINEKFINNASQVFEEVITKSKNKISNALQNTGDFVDIPGNDPLWAESFVRVVNRQMRNSKLTSRILAGQSFDEVVTFLKTDPQGQRIATVIGGARGGESAEEIARINFENVRHMFPEGIADGLRAIAKERNINADDVIKFLGTDSSVYPTVNGAQISIANGTHPAVGLYTRTLESFYKNFGSIPENTLTKSPLYVDLYRKRMAASIDRAIKTSDSPTLSSEYVKKMENDARQWARSELRRELYDMSERTDAAYTMKYFFPFFGAFSDVAEKWGKIVINDPSVLAKLNTIYTSPDRLGMTEERDGITYINIPSSWSKAMGIQRELSIPKASLNLIFQGGAWWNPGAGWFVQAAASQLMTRFPELEQNKLMTEILPFGAQDRTWKDLVLQSASIRKLAAVFDEADPQRSNLTALILAEEMTKYQNGERDTEPTKGEINRRALLNLGIQVASRATLPFALNTRSPYQFYIDEYRRMREEDSNTAGAKFYNTYGEVLYNFAGSLSKNNTGINATIDADKRTKELQDLLALAPQYGWFLVGDANTGAFSPTVYGNQYAQAVAPGSTVKMRERQDPYEAFNKTQADKGWIQFKEGTAMLEALRIRAGFSSLNASGAEYLRDKKQELVAIISRENPAWAESYGKIDSGAVTSFLRFADKVKDDPRISGRPDVVSLKQYMEGREIIRGILASRDSKSIDAASNADLRVKWDELIGMLINQDVTFGDIYSRILDKDDLTKGL